MWKPILLLIALLLIAAPAAAQTPTPYVPPSSDGGVTTVGASAGDADELPSETSWTTWAETIDELFNPITLKMWEIEENLLQTRDETCSTGMAEFLPGDDYNFAIIDLPDDPTPVQISYHFGLALGRPVGYLRGVEASGVADLNYLSILIWTIMAGLTWISFVTTIVYGIRIGRWLLEGAARIWELVPFKSS